MFALNFVACPGMLDVDVWDDGCGRILKFNPAPSTAIHSASLQCMEMERSNLGRNHQKWISHYIHFENCKILQVTAIIMYNVRYDSHLKLIYYQNVREKLLSNSSDIGNCFLLPNEATFKQISSNFPTSIITSTENG